MTLRNLPEVKGLPRPQSYQWEAPSDVLSKWADRPLAAEADDPSTISIYDVIGEDWWTGAGFTAKRMASALRSIGPKPVTVKINSPGGDMFEGVTIYNQLREHPAKVTIDVMGWAASAASVIAMAGDEIRMGLGSFMMIHNAWGIVIGNRHDMRSAADLFDGFDAAMVDIYEARTGNKRAEIEKLMDAETFMGPTEAIAKKFADTQFEGVGDDAKASGAGIDRALLARRQIEAALAKAGVPRGSRHDMIGELLANNRGVERDADPRSAARDAGINVGDVQSLIDAMKSV